MKSYEILAPVGADEQLKAAVRCGADAVYLGTGNFNARRNADNFSGENLKNAVKYCHLRNVKVYVTLNTLVFDKEINELYETVKEIAESGADAIIVQDFASVKAIKEICPQMPLHASTQMAVHNISGATHLEALGFSRVVLARELSFNEIKAIREQVNTELEVFVHGAHCMGSSGNCYLSSMLGERSGNRGLCAQGCRLNWKSQHGRDYALSLKDMSYLDSINDLKSIGIESFKIEGRMKRPEYVAASVTALKNALQNNPYDKDALRSVFSRNGFTDGYLKATRDISMFGYRNKEDVTSASLVLKNLEALYRNDIHPTEIDVSLSLKKDQPSTLAMSADGITVSVSGAIPEEPRTSPLSQEIALRNISKLGDTAFYLNKFEFTNTDNLTMSASSINALRRDAVEKLENELTKPKYVVENIVPTTISSHSPCREKTLRIRLQNLSQYSPIFNDTEFIILPIDETIKHKEEIQKLPVEIMVELPQLIYPSYENKIREKLDIIREMGISHAFAGNIGAINILKEKGFVIHGSHGLNITNSLALSSYQEMGLKDTALSFELTEKSIKNMGGDIKRGIYVYGYLPLMLMRSCPQKNTDGCGSCDGKTYLTDRKNIDFSVICNNKEFSVLYNSIPLYIGDKVIKNIDFNILYFTIETRKECENIYRSFKNGKTVSGPKTNGLFFRELL